MTKSKSKQHGLKAGDTVIRTVRWNSPRTNFKLVKSELRIVDYVTAAGYVYLRRDFGDKYHGDDFPLRRWHPRGWMQPYRIYLLRDTPENRTEYNIPPAATGKPMEKPHEVPKQG